MSLSYLANDLLLVGEFFLVGPVIDLSLYLLQQFFVLSQDVFYLDQLFVVGLDVCPAFDYDELILFVF